MEKERVAKQQATSKQQILAEMKNAIQPILNAVNDDKKVIERYKIESLGLITGGILCSLSAIGYLAYRLFPEGGSDAISSFNILQFLSPGLILALIGTGLFRHDWKVRQLTLKLIEQNNRIDIAMGLLQASLNLSNIGTVDDIKGSPDLVKETFKEARTALLFKAGSASKEATTDSSAESKVLQKLIAQLIKPSAKQ